MNRKALIWIISLIALATGAFGFRSCQRGAIESERERLALATARLSVFETLSDLADPEKYAARDSILAISETDSLELDAYVKSFEGDEGGLSEFWKAVRRHTDSLIELELTRRIPVDTTADSSPTSK
ncbi:MAG: hypothetical protein ACE5GA_09550 [Candidatus Zixiibacteriota bacterium]